MKKGRVEKLLIILILVFILATVFVCLHLHALLITLMLVLLTTIGLYGLIALKKQLSLVAKQQHELTMLKNKAVMQREEEAAMLSNASHEMRTPLTTIAGIAEGLQYGVISPDEQQHSYDLIKEEADRLTRLIKSTLSYERLRQQQLENQPENFNVVQLVRRQIDQLIKQAEAVGNEIQDLTKQDIFVYADPDQVAQILTNILANAIQFTTNGIITVSVETENNQARIIITDTGIGMTEDQLSKMWQRYYKVDPSRTKRGESGLGMAIVQQLVSANHGEIKVSSKLGIGTTFEIILPAMNK
ncbi:sensor histidine kinase [Weissella jogaejeotgali]|uniref:histidine kinase n=1 Tax=Weissella jogaejeotgali TaxID=1631871 RepID=A0A1L6R9W9_9LACO|nr:HAMP domain-containing sensor histidine kinase [Weissella jogaejeotgali]APS41341.1 sensor histidine kinase [Weissella jogaejeotgali]